MKDLIKGLALSALLAGGLASAAGNSISLTSHSDLLDYQLTSATSDLPVENIDLVGSSPADDVEKILISSNGYPGAAPIGNSFFSNLTYMVDSFDTVLFYPSQILIGPLYDKLAWLVGPSPVPDQLGSKASGFAQEYLAAATQYDTWAEDAAHDSSLADATQWHTRFLDAAEDDTEIAHAFQAYADGLDSFGFYLKSWENTFIYLFDAFGAHIDPVTGSEYQLSLPENLTLTVDKAGNVVPYNPDETGTTTYPLPYDFAGTWNNGDPDPTGTFNPLSDGTTSTDTFLLPGADFGDILPD